MLFLQINKVEILSMRRLLLFLHVITLFVVTACGAPFSKVSTYDEPQSVFITPNHSIEGKVPPLEFKEILSSLNLLESSKSRKDLGYHPEAKMLLFNVKAHVEYGDGWLIASGRGEWGGIVFWLNKNGDYKIIRDDDFAYPIDLIAEGNTIFITQGMNHMAPSDGHLLQINRNNGTFKTKVYPLKGYPSIYKQHDEEFIIPVDYYEDRNFHKGYYVLSELLTGKSLLHEARWIPSAHAP